MKIDINKVIHNFYIEIGSPTDSEYIFLYDDIDNDILKYIFAYFHKIYNDEFQFMNRKIKCGNYHFNADNSRNLINNITYTKKLYRTLKKTIYEFEINSYYAEIINLCEHFLDISGGSQVPQDMCTIMLYDNYPIFKLNNDKRYCKKDISYTLSMIGEGSYAYTYSYKDEEYDKKIALKCAKKELNDKELERFYIEFKTMKKLSSPYIVDVYKYDQENYQYTMEYIPYTLEQYISHNNNNISLNIRISICNQIISGFKYLYSKNILHRDISLNNILIQPYDDVCVVKISDFGLVKLPNSHLTSLDTQVKGSLNDPQLHQIGFKNYGVQHEIYAITRVIAYVLTGKKNISNITDEKINNFINNGTCYDLSKRYKNIDELHQGFQLIVKNLGKN